MRLVPVYNKNVASIATIGKKFMILGEAGNQFRVGGKLFFL
jgi:hypothetical protein